MSKKKIIATEPKVPSKGKSIAAPAKVAVVAKQAGKKPVAPKQSPVAAPVVVAVKEKRAKATAAPKKQKNPQVVQPAASIEAKIAEPQTLAITTLLASVDIGFGNLLYVRGEGAGLSWEQGLPMVNLAPDRWQVVLGGVTSPIVFKYLLNDLQWSIGEDFVAAPGSTTVGAPVFE